MIQSSLEVLGEQLFIDRRPGSQQICLNSTIFRDGSSSDGTGRIISGRTTAPKQISALAISSRNTMHVLQQHWKVIRRDSSRRHLRFHSRSLSIIRCFDRVAGFSLLGPVNETAARIELRGGTVQRMSQVTKVRDQKWGCWMGVHCTSHSGNFWRNSFFKYCPHTGHSFCASS